MTRNTALSFVAGYVDTLGFIALHGLFTAHVTGNFVLLGREVVAPGNDVLLKLLAFPAFVAGVVAVRALVRLRQRTGSDALRPAHLLQAALLLASAAAARWDMAAGLLCAAGMGAQNGYGKLLLAKLPASTVMTGNVTQLVIDCLDRVDGAPRPALASLAGGILAFGLGCMAGALASQWGMAVGLLPAAVLLLGLAWFSQTDNAAL
ncbi:YoaK family protein [Pseudoduganella violaceinigra]|uniref:YoaK family protein n=1 Tax=Pseudoduganella violaceinigra TaxID=246602 RepID=UPI00042737B3|nr:YoaK family protein [Pseudoduganella violaceinigra]